MLQIQLVTVETLWGKYAAWGRSGWECRNKIEKDVKEEEEHCANVAAYLYFLKWHMGNGMQLQTCRWKKKEGDSLVILSAKNYKLE